MRFVHNRGNRVKEGKSSLSIEVRLIGTNKAVYIPTGIKLYNNQFSNKNGLTVKNHRQPGQVMARAREVFNKVEAFAMSDECRSLSDVKNYDKTRTLNKNVIDFMREELRKKNPSYATIEYNNSLIKRLEEYGKIKFFRDLTLENIEGFDAHLRKTIKSQPTLYKRHGAFKSYIAKAVKLGYCKYNPYDDFRVKKGDPLKTPVYLTEEEMDKVKKLNPVNEKLERARDLFIFQCYTGLAFVDLMNFSPGMISEEGGYKIITGYRAKTGARFITLLLPEAERVLEKYNGELPRLSNQKYNDYLKLVAAAAEIDKNITSHSARHTFATYLLNNDIPIETVSKAVGHASIKQTEHYAKLLGKKVIKDMSVLIEMKDEEKEKAEG